MAIAHRCDCGAVQPDNPASMKKVKFFLNCKDGEEYCKPCYKKNVPFLDRVKNAVYRLGLRTEMRIRRFRNKLVFGKS